MKISKKAIMRLTGWSEQQYKREYSKFAGKVRNLNRLAGAKYSTTNELYYSILEPENATVRAIKEMSSARKGTTASMRKVAYDYVEERFRGLIRDNAEVKEMFEQIGKRVPTRTGKMRKYSLKQFNAFAKRYAKKLSKAREKNILIGSDYTMQELDEEIARSEREENGTGQTFTADEDFYENFR